MRTPLPSFSLQARLRPYAWLPSSSLLLSIFPFLCSICGFLGPSQLHYFCTKLEAEEACCAPQRQVLLHAGGLSCSLSRTLLPFWAGKQHLLVTSRVTVFFDWEEAGVCRVSVGASAWKMQSPGRSRVYSFMNLQTFRQQPNSGNLDFLLNYSERIC